MTWRCASCGHLQDAHWLRRGACLICLCPRYVSPWWVSLKNALWRWWRA